MARPGPDKAGQGNAERARLLGNHNRDGIGVLGHTQRSAVARTEHLASRCGLVTQRKHTPRRDDAVGPHDDGHVVQGRVGEEDRFEQFVEEFYARRDREVPPLKDL